MSKCLELEQALGSLSGLEYAHVFRAYTAEWTHEERKDYLQLKAAEQATRVQQLRARRPQKCSIDDFCGALIRLDCANEQAVTEFWRTFSKSGLGPATDPILLGTTAGVRKRWDIFLRTEMLAFWDVFDVQNETTVEKPHPHIVAFRSTHSPKIVLSKSTIQYGICLSTLAYCLTSSTEADAHHLPVNVYMDVLDKSLWLVLSTYYEDDLGEQILTTDKDLNSFFPFLTMLQGCRSVKFSSAEQLGHGETAFPLSESAASGESQLESVDADIKTVIEAVKLASEKRDK